MLRLDNISIGYNGQEIAAQQQAIELNKGQFIALLGTNGSGKSTLLRAVTTGAHLLKGTCSIEGKNTNMLSDNERATTIAVVLTSKEINPLLTVKELMAISRAPYTSFTGKVNDVDKQIIAETMETFTCADLQNRRLETLSDGQLQRVLVARAIVQDTPYIFMDEPSSHLDINHKASLLANLATFCKEKNKTIIYASHELEIALALSDAVISIDRGQIAYNIVEEFIKSNMLNNMFPSKYVSFENGKAVYNFK
ncbi:MAG: ABC transporter ATP-binding protein [Nonlabens sp.]|nr:ABC transporter ATP-binding protein [Nonlabens sp.]